MSREMMALLGKLYDSFARDITYVVTMGPAFGMLDHKLTWKWEGKEYGFVFPHAEALIARVSEEITAYLADMANLRKADDHEVKRIAQPQKPQVVQGTATEEMRALEDKVARDPGSWTNDEYGVCNNGERYLRIVDHVADRMNRLRVGQSTYGEARALVSWLAYQEKLVPHDMVPDRAEYENMKMKLDTYAMCVRDILTRYSGVHLAMVDEIVNRCKAAEALAGWTYAEDRSFYRQGHAQAYRDGQRLMVELLVALVANKDEPRMKAIKKCAKYLVHSYRERKELYDVLPEEVVVLSR